MTIAWSSTASPSTASAEPGAARLNLRVLVRLFGLVLLFLALAPMHLAAKLVLRRSPWPHRFLAAAGWISGARVNVVGRGAGRHTLLAANHVNWLDILVLAGATGCAFVSKDDLGHPFIHWLADQNRTIYVDRSARRDVSVQAAKIGEALARGEIVAFFPEGTVGPGDRLLPFRPPLFTAAESADADVEVRPVAIDYGAAATQISWFGESGKQNFLKVLGRRGVIPVTVHLLDPLAPGNRKQLAQAASQAIGQSLGFKSDGRSPIGARE